MPAALLATAVAALAFALVVAGGLAALYALTVVPFLMAVDGAERRGLAPGRWAAAAVVAGVAALGTALLVHRAGGGLLWLLPPLLPFLPAAVVRTPGARRWGGRAGRHEQPL